MEYRNLYPGTDVSVLSLGVWQTFERIDFADCVELVDAAYRGGVNLFDVARYHPESERFPPRTIAPGSVHTEVIFGRVLQELGLPREAYRIAEKLWFDRFPAESMRDQLRASLRRLGIDQVEVVYCQLPPPGVDRADLVRDVAAAVRDGLARGWGVLNWPAAWVEEAWLLAEREGIAGPQAIELMYNLIRPFSVQDPDYVELFRRRRLKVQATRALEAGVLAGRHPDDSVRVLGADPGDARAEFLPQLDRYRSLCRRLDVKPSQVALAFCLRNQFVTSVLFGARDTSQLRDNLGALTITDDIIDQVVGELGSTDAA